MFASTYPDHVRTVTARVQEALDQGDWDGVVFTSGGMRAKTRFDDQDWPFQPLPFFRWFAPLEWPGAAVVLRSGEAPVLHARAEDSFWEAPPPADWSLIESGIEVSADEFKLGSGRWAIIGEADDVQGGERNPAALVAQLEDERTVKTPHEILAMQQASSIAAMGHRAAAKDFLQGDRSELSIHLTYLKATGQDDHETPYKNIVALGRHAATLHHISYGTMPDARSMLIDAGAMSVGYCSDITRTHVHEDGTEEAALFARLVRDLDDLQQELVSSVKVGMNYEELHDLAHLLLGQLLQRLELVTVSGEAANENGITRALFPHGLGHSIGVVTHDVGCLRRKPSDRNPFLRNTRTIEPGQVFTIEPGCYFVPALLEKVRAEHPRALNEAMIRILEPFGGVRIEDDVLVLHPEEADERGSPVRNLTREAFAEY
jgi:Xaa-Pro dipeptidase